MWIAVLLLALPASAALAAPAAQAPCALTTINVREGPGAGYRRVGLINPGECITVLGVSPDNQWYQIAQGWVWAAPHVWTGEAANSTGLTVGLSPAPAGGAHIVSAVGFVSDHAPQPGQAVVAHAVIQIDGAPRGGIPVAFAWGSGPSAFHCTSVTDSLGVAACLHHVSSGPAGEIVPVVAAFRAYGRDYTVTASYAVNGNCDLSYLEFCLPPGLPPQTCATIPYRDFLVLPPDTYGFDPDGDNIGCET
jgi:hypothetical protein